MEYRRPWEKDKAPEREFVVTVEVAPEKAATPAQ
jgi:predicted secreted protein